MRLRPGSNRRFVTILTLLVLTPTLLMMAATPSTAKPALPCSSTQNPGVITEVDGVLWQCLEVWDGVWDWVAVPKRERNNLVIQRAKNQVFVSSATNSLSSISSTIAHHVGGEGNFGQADISIFGTGGNKIARPIGARVIVSHIVGGGWTACHDSNWHYASSSTSHFAWREPANCGSDSYRAQSAGEYYSYSLGRWLTSSWVTTLGMCIPAAPSCNV